MRAAAPAVGQVRSMTKASQGLWKNGIAGFLGGVWEGRKLAGWVSRQAGRQTGGQADWRANTSECRLGNAPGSAST